MIRELRDPRDPRRRRAAFGAAEARGQLGLALFHGGRDGEAEAQLSCALSVCPDDPELRYVRARLYQRSGRPAAALADLGHAIAERPRDPELYMLLAVCHGPARDRGLSARALDRAVALTRGPARWRDGAPGSDAAGPRRSAAGGEHRPPPAHHAPARGRSLHPDLEPLARAVKVHPCYPDLRCRLASWLLEAGRVAEGEIELERALRINPRYLRARLLLARLRLERGDTRRAARLLVDTLEAHPDYPDIQFWLALAHFRAGEPELALPPLERAVALNRHFARAQRLLGLVHHVMGRHDEALRLLACGFSRDRELPGRLDGEATDARMDAEAGGAEHRLSGAIARQPDYPDLHLALAWLHRSHGRLERARESCRAALGLEPDYAAAALELAGLELALGRPAVAEPLLREIARRQPRWPDGLALLGRAHRMRGDPAGAAPPLTAALRLNPGCAAARADLTWAMRALRSGGRRHALVLEDAHAFRTDAHTRPVGEAAPVG